MHPGRNIPHFLYTCLIILLGFWLLSYVFAEVNLDLGRELLILAALAILAEWLAVAFPRGRLSGGFAVVLSSYLLFGPAATAWVFGLATLVGQGIVNRGNPARTAVFNASQHVLAILGADYVFKLAGGIAGGGLAVVNILPLAAFVLIYFSINQILVYIYLLPKFRYYPLLVWTDMLRWDALTYLFTVPFGVLMVLIYGKIGIYGALLLFLPVLATQFVLRLYVRLEMANRELRALFETARGLGGSNKLEDVLALLLRESRRAVSYHTGIVYLWSDDAGAYIAAAVKGPYEKSLRGSHVTPGVGLVGRALAGCQTEIIYDSRLDVQLKDEPGLAQVHRSLLVIPLLAEGGSIGALVLGDKRPYAFDGGNLQTLCVMGSQAAIVLGTLLQRRQPPACDLCPHRSST